jgi:hypothetical protein
MAPAVSSGMTPIVLGRDPLPICLASNADMTLLAAANRPQSEPSLDLSNISLCHTFCTLRRDPQFWHSFLHYYLQFPAD